MVAGDDLTWVLQQGAIGAADRDRLAAAIRAGGWRLEELAVVPFSHEPAGPVPSIAGPCLVYGSSGLLALARRLGWSPAGWDGEGFAASAVARELGPLALNGEARAVPWSRAAEAAEAAGWGRVFVRPDAEAKEFAGRTMDAADLAAWVGRLRAQGYFAERDPAVLVGPVRRLGREWRLFLVDGRVVASGQYAQGGEPARGPEAPAEALDLAHEALAHHAPAPALVMDVAEVEEADGRWALRVVELNSINSAGFYGCDPIPVVMALSALAVRLS